MNGSTREVSLKHYVEINPLTDEFKILSENEEVTFLPLENIWSGGKTDYSTKRPWKKSDTSYTQFRRGDVLVPKVTPTVFHGRSTVAETETEVGIATSEVHVLRPKKGVEAKWVAYNVLSSQFLDRARGEVYGVGGLQRISAGYLGSYKVMETDLVNQQRIADYLDRETADIDAAVADLDRYVKLLEKRRQVLIIDALACRKGPGVTVNGDVSQFGRGRVGLVSTLLRRGISPAYVDDGIPVVNQKCVKTGGNFDGTLCRFHDLQSREIPDDLIIKSGDILINSTGTGTLGRSCIVSEIDVAATWDSHVTLVRPNTSEVEPRYLGWVIYSQESKLIEFSTGSTNQIELSRDTVFNLDIPMLPRELQHEIANYLDEETAEIDSLTNESKKLRALLLKRRSVLITDVVTGRKQV